MKIIFLAILLVLSLQIHLQNNPLANESFLVLWNAGSSQVKATLRFTADNVSFKGCNENSATYQIFDGSNGLKISSWASIKSTCSTDRDSILIRALNLSRKFTFSEDGTLSLSDAQDNLTVKAINLKK